MIAKGINVAGVTLETIPGLHQLDPKCYILTDALQWNAEILSAVEAELPDARRLISIPDIVGNPPLGWFTDPKPYVFYLNEPEIPQNHTVQEIAAAINLVVPQYLSYNSNTKFSLPYAAQAGGSYWGGQDWFNGFWSLLTDEAKVAVNAVHCHLYPPNFKPHWVVAWLAEQQAGLDAIGAALNINLSEIGFNGRFTGDPRLDTYYSNLLNKLELSELRISRVLWYQSIAVDGYVPLMQDTTLTNVGSDFIIA